MRDRIGLIVRWCSGATHNAAYIAGPLEITRLARAATRSWRSSMQTFAVWAGAAMCFLAPPALADPLKEAFVPDATFNYGFIIDDRFATVSNDTDFHGRKIARLSDGNVVVVGLVPAAYQVDQANGLFNIGLVRYGPAGERVPWPAPSAAYVSFFDRYIQFPNAYSKFSRIGGLVVAGGFIFVLADYTFSESQQQADVVVFREDGTYIGWYIASSTLFESGVGMVSFTLGGVRRLFTVNRVLNWIMDDSANYGFYERYLGLNRFTVGADGALTGDAAFGSGGRSDIRDHTCTYYTGDCDFDAVAISLVGSGNATLGVYEAYAVARWCAFCRGGLVVGGSPLQVTKFSPTTGSLIQRSVVELAEPGPGGLLFDLDPRDIVATRSVLVGGGFADSVYLLARTGNPCAGNYPGAGAVALVDGSGTLDPTFGTGGFVHFGTPQACPAADVATADPQALALGAYDRLAVVGSVHDGAVNPAESAPFLAILRTDLGGVADDSVQPALQYNGTPWGSLAGFYDVIATDGATFTAAGTMTTASAAAQFGTARYHSDRIFADDF